MYSAPDKETMAQGFTIKSNSNELYKIEEEQTVGWTLIKSDITKEECKEQYEKLIADGVSPDRIKITRLQ